MKLCGGCRLQERLLELIDQSFVLGGLLVLHQPRLLMEMCCSNIATREPGVAPMGHFISAAGARGRTHDCACVLACFLHVRKDCSMLLMRAYVCANAVAGRLRVRQNGGKKGGITT